uniref:Glycosyltransferase family 92 protein n=1 Tax=Globodera rostochiensis TaxID=31243 RepID=A0A914I5S8_GLORO
MPFVWIVRRAFLFTAVRLLRLWSFFWRGDHQRFLWRLRRNNVVRLSPELFQHCLITTPFTAAMSKAKQPRARRWLARVGRCALLALLFLLSITFNLPWSTQHMAIISSNYYPHSASNPPNTMVVLFNAQRRFWPPWPLLCRSFNGSHSLTALARVRYAFTPILICGWSVYLASCPTVQRPIEFQLRDVQMISQSVTVPFRRVSDAKLSVVACFSPLFYNERWQLIIPTLEIYRQLGVSLQVYYIQSMLVEILDFMKVYEKQNIVRLETWVGLNVQDSDGIDTLGYDPNTELEWRNQAAAHTDCLLFYKVCADRLFLIVSDLDDVLIPKLGRTFLEEFRWLSAKMPYAAGFSYNRYNTELVTSSESAEFSLAALINEARVANEWEDPKYVVKPANVQSVWLHWPGIINRGRMYTVPAELNFMLHFRNWSMIDFHSSAYPRTQRTFELFTYQMADMLQPARAVELERNFHDFLAYTPELADLFARLPSRVVYYPLVADCYNRIFYDRSKHPINCPGPVRCDLPSLPGLKCAVAKRRVAHLTINRHLNVHVPLDASGTFHISDNGCSWT